MSIPARQELAVVAGNRGEAAVRRFRKGGYCPTRCGGLRRDGIAAAAVKRMVAFPPCSRPLEAEKHAAPAEFTMKADIAPSARDGCVHDQTASPIHFHGGKNRVGAGGHADPNQGVE